jgi:hypothetical protein
MFVPGTEDTEDAEPVLLFVGSVLPLAHDLIKGDASHERTVLRAELIDCRSR